ncbi:MAG TPA: aspartate kinase [Aggregatilineales bacterium]|nr:aspartate kinase [Aggregatilineales bacterium]
MRTLTLKFGGTSMGGADAIAQVARIICDHHAQGYRILTVVSAMAGTTDQLLQAASTSAAGDEATHLGLVSEIRNRHHETAERLIQDSKIKEALFSDLDSLLEGLNALCHSIAVLREVTPRGMDLIASFGERLSARLLAAHLRDLGNDAIAIDANDLIITDENFQAAVPYMDETRKRVQEYLIPCLEADSLPVVTGFIGATRKGIITTLGRGGSDFSGAILGAVIDTDELWIYTDVDGIMTTDPRIAPSARVIPVLSYGEVGELSYFGAKVLHPKTVQPVIEKGSPVRVRNTFNPTHMGTLIQPQSEITAGAIKAVTIIKDVSLVSVEGRGMVGVPGIAGRTFMAVARARTSMLMISQSSSEQSFCFVIPTDRVEPALTAIREELQIEIGRTDVDRIWATDDAVIITVVGAGMRGTPGVASRVCGALAAEAINILVIAQGSSEYSISLVVAASDGIRAVKVLHDLIV